MGENTRSMIFTIYGDYIHHYGNRIWIGSLIRLLKEFGHNDQAARVAVSRMMKQGWLQSEKQDNRSYYFLTEQGISRIEEAGNRIFKLNPIEWDGKWRVLMYTIPEEKRHIRDELRQELLWSGFGSFSNACWISPNNLEKEVKLLIEKYDISEYVDFFISEYIGPKDNHTLVEKSWPLEQVVEKYEEFIIKYSKQFIANQEIIKRGEMSDADCFVERTKLVHEYRKFLFLIQVFRRNCCRKIGMELLPLHYLTNIIKFLLNQLAAFSKAFFKKTMIFAKKMSPMMPNNIRI